MLALQYPSLMQSAGGDERSSTQTTHLHKSVEVVVNDGGERVVAEIAEIQAQMDRVAANTRHMQEQVDALLAEMVRCQNEQTAYGRDDDNLRC